MEQKDNTLAMLDLMPCPAFCVEQGVITHVNPAAATFRLSPGKSIDGLLETGREEYSRLEDGDLSLTLCIDGRKLSASVSRLQLYDVFVLDQDADQPELQALALAAQNLRSPLSSLMTVADRLPESSDIPSATLNRSLYQLLRIVSNMSDAYLYSQMPSPKMEIRNIPAIFDELFEKVAAYAVQAGITVTFQSLDEIVFGLADAQQLQRAVENLLANALKFTPAGGTVAARLTRNGGMLYLTICDNGEGLKQNVRQNFYDRFRRPPMLEDSRNGIGLGMMLVRSIASVHGGTVLVQQDKERGTKLTMTIAIRQNSDSAVRSPVMQIDYTGGRDHTLVELSETLPAELYK